MTTDNILTIDDRVLQTLSGGDKVSRLLCTVGGSVHKWAVSNRLSPTEVYYTLNGQRPYPNIRKKIAKAIGVSLEELNDILDGSKAEVIA